MTVAEAIALGTVGVTLATLGIARLIGMGRDDEKRATQQRSIDDLAPRTDRHEADIAALRAQVAAIQQRISEIGPRVHTQGSTLAGLQGEVMRLDEGLADLGERLKALEHPRRPGA